MLATNKLRSQEPGGVHNGGSSRITWALQEKSLVVNNNNVNGGTRYVRSLFEGDDAYVLVSTTVNVLSHVT